MTTHKTCGRRRLTVLLCVLLLFCTALAPPAFAAGVTVSTTSATAYFQTYASTGTWVDIGTPQHMINETGKVAYCLQTSLNSPSNSGYSATRLPGLKRRLYRRSGPLCHCQRHPLLACRERL